MSKQKARASPAQLTGLFKADSIRDVAESLNIPGIPDAVAFALASDVEYRIHQVVEEAARFMRHARRTTLTTSDIDQALRVLNIEPLYGHFPHNPPTFRRAPPYPHLQAAGSVYFVEDEEIDFERVIREEKITLPKGARWTAHWLAVEGVQPLIPENPPAEPREPEADGVMRAGISRQNGYMTPSSDRASPLQNGTAHQGPHGRTTLSRELQLYLTRLTSSLLPVNQTEFEKRAAALASLSGDAGLQPLLPNLVSWVTRHVVRNLQNDVRRDEAGPELDVLMDVIDKILENSSLFVEPYLHQILPAILSTLLHSELSPQFAPALRTKASQVLSKLLTRHSTTYPSLSPRIMKTLLLALLSSDKKRGTREGAIRGLMGIGKEAIRKGLIEGGGAKVVGSECSPGDQGTLVAAVMAAFQVLHQPSRYPVSLNPNDFADSGVIAQLRETLGDFFAEKLMGDGEWAHGVLVRGQDG